MDDETRASIDSLLFEKKKSFVTREHFKKATLEESFRASYPERKKAEPKLHTYEEMFGFSKQEREIMSLKNEVATLSVDTASASIVFKGPLNDELIKRIENAVPMTQREWLGDKRAWRFAPAALPIIKPILKDTYKDIHMLGVPKALPSTKFDQLMSKLSKDDKAQVYRLLAAKYHPDKGGSHELMTLINTVFRG